MAGVPGDTYPDPCNLIVNYVPTPVTDAELYAMFSQYGELVSARVIIDRVTGHPKGYGFVKYKNVDDAGTAMARMNGFQIHGKRLKVTPARGFQSNTIDAYAMRQSTLHPPMTGVPVYEAGPGPYSGGPSLELASNNHSPFGSHYASAHQHASSPASVDPRNVHLVPAAPEQPQAPPPPPLLQTAQPNTLEIPAGAPTPPQAF